MYELHELPNGMWKIVIGHKQAFKGSFQSVVIHCLAKLTFPSEQLEMAVSEMCKNGHNAAHFGVFKKLIYTYNKQIERN